MTAARIRLALAAALFLAWIGWLAYLASTTTRPVVLARPQLLNSDLDVVAEVKGTEEHPDADVRVVEVLWARDRHGPKPKALTVADLDQLGRDNGWRGPGRYLLPLKKKKTGAGVEYRVAEVGRSPGYPPAGEPAAPYRIYPDTPETREQLEKIRSGDWE